MTRSASIATHLVHTARRCLLLSATALGLLTATAGALAHGYTAGDLRIGHPWARPTANGQSVGGGYLKLTSQGGADRLVSATTPLAASVELHRMSMDGDVMRMRRVDAIEVPAGQTVELKPGGLHLMLMGLKQPLQLGEKIPLTLQFEKAGAVNVELKIEHPKSGTDGAPAAGGAHDKHH